MAGRGVEHRGPGQRSRAPALRRAREPLGLAAAAAAGSVLLLLRSPYVPRSYGLCPSLALLGLACPACGGLRATHDLLTGDVAAAWHANPLWTLAVPVLVAAWAAWTSRRLRNVPRPAGPSWLPWATLGVLTVFTVLRNVPALAPALGPPALP